MFARNDDKEAWLWDEEFILNGGARGLPEATARRPAENLPPGMRPKNLEAPESGGNANLRTQTTAQALSSISNDKIVEAQK